MGALDELSAAARASPKGAGTAVVRVGRHGGRGCGVVIGPGQVLTNAHNLRGSEITVTFSGDRVLTGRVTGVDVDGDLAVVAVDTGDAPAIEWSDDRPASATCCSPWRAARAGAPGCRSAW